MSRNMTDWHFRESIEEFLHATVSQLLRIYVGTQYDLSAQAGDLEDAKRSLLAAVEKDKKAIGNRVRPDEQVSDNEEDVDGGEGEEVENGGGVAAPLKLHMHRTKKKKKDDAEATAAGKHGRLLSLLILV